MTRDERLNASLPSFLLHSMSSPLTVSARARLLPARFGANPPQSRPPRSARRRRAAACRSPYPSVRTCDTSLLSGSCHFAVLPGLSKMQKGRWSVHVTPCRRDTGILAVLPSRRVRSRPSPSARPDLFPRKTVANPLLSRRDSLPHHYHVGCTRPSRSLPVPLAPPAASLVRAPGNARPWVHHPHIAHIGHVRALPAATARLPSAQGPPALRFASRAARSAAAFKISRARALLHYPDPTTSLWWLPSPSLDAYPPRHARGHSRTLAYEARGGSARLANGGI
jgi:hypothetical protein